MGDKRHNRRAVLKSAAFGLTGMNFLPADLTLTRQQGYSHSLVIFGGSRTAPATYEFRVSGRAEKSGEDHGAPVNNAVTIDPEDTIDGHTISGAVAGAGDAYHFSGELQTLTVDGLARVFVDGSEIDPTTIGPSLSSTLVIFGGNPNTVINYQFSVSGTLEKSGLSHGAPISNQSVTIDPDDTINRSTGTATGAIAGGGDAYRYSGELTEFTSNGDATVYRNGSNVPTGDLPGGSGNPPDDSDGRSDDDDPPSSFTPQFEFYCFSVVIDAPSYTDVRLEMTDGSTQEFTGAYSGKTEFGFGNMPLMSPSESFDGYHGDIARVTVTNSEGATATREKPVRDRCRIKIECETVTVDYCADQFDVRFRDGTRKYFIGGATCNSDGPLTIGSPGRIIESTDALGGPTIPNPNASCTASSALATTFDCTSVTIGAEEFIPGPPEFAGATLTFTDGTSQSFGVTDPIAGGGSTATDSYTAPQTFAGTGEHEGKVITEVQIAQLQWPAVFRIPNHAVDTCVQNANVAAQQTTETTTTEKTPTPEDTPTPTTEDTPTPTPEKTPTPTPEDTPTPTPEETPTPTPEEEPASTETAGLLHWGLVGTGLRRVRGAISPAPPERD